MDGLDFFFEEAESGLVPRAHAGDILGGGIDVVESMVASIHEARGRSSDVMSSEPMVGSCRNGGSEVVGDSNDMVAQNTAIESMGDEGDAEDVVVNKTKTSCWTRRIGKAPEETDANPSRFSALEASLRAYADNKVCTVGNPALGTSFDTVVEAYEVYNSSETGFGVRASHCNRTAARRGVDAPR